MKAQAVVPRCCLRLKVIFGYVSSSSNLAEAGTQGFTKKDMDTWTGSPFLKKSTRDKSSRFYLVAEDTSAEDMNEQLVNVNARKGTMSTILLL